MGRRKKDKKKYDRPEHLNWKIFDDPSKVPDDQLFYKGEVKLTYCQRKKIDECAMIVRNIYVPKLLALFESWEQEKKLKREEEARLKQEEHLIAQRERARRPHLEIAGGNYTFFFLLPKIIKYMRAKYPHMPVKLSLFEVGGGTSLSRQRADIILHGDLISDYVRNAEIKNEARLAGYVALCKSYEDEMYLAASKEAVSIYGGNEETLAKHDVLFGRDYADSSVNVEMIQLYSTMPKGRETVKPRVVVDQYYMKYLMTRDGTGIGHVHKSMPYDSSKIALLGEECFARYVRYCLLHKELRGKKYRQVARSIMNLFTHEMGTNKSPVRVKSKE